VDLSHKAKIFRAQWFLTLDKEKVLQKKMQTSLVFHSAGHIYMSYVGDTLAPNCVTYKEHTYRQIHTHTLAVLHNIELHPCMNSKNFW